MAVHIDRGDFLTFASIAAALDVPYEGPDWGLCEVEDGIWRRHPEIGTRSRSDISRDGYMGVIFNCLVNDDQESLDRIIDAGWGRGWTMGDRGHWDYVNIAPLAPILLATRWGWFPTLPTLCTGWNNRGFRAHLLALTIVIERLIGKDRWSHRQGAKGIHEKDPNNPWFRVLYQVVHDMEPTIPRKFRMEKSGYSWGGCPGEVHKALTLFTARLR